MNPGYRTENGFIHLECRRWTFETGDSRTEYRFSDQPEVTSCSVEALCEARGIPINQLAESLAPHLDGHRIPNH